MRRGWPGNSSSCDGRELARPEVFGRQAPLRPRAARQLTRRGRCRLSGRSCPLALLPRSALASCPRLEPLFFTALSESRLTLLGDFLPIGLLSPSFCFIALAAYFPALPQRFFMSVWRLQSPSLHPLGRGVLLSFLVMPHANPFLPLLLRGFQSVRGLLQLLPAFQLPGSRSVLLTPRLVTSR